MKYDGGGTESQKKAEIKNVVQAIRNGSLFEEITRFSYIVSSFLI